MRISRIEYKWLVGLIFVVGLFMDLLDMTVTNVAIPTLSERFGASTTTIEWVITGYLLSLAVFIPLSGWLGDRFGTKRIFSIALATFTTASLLCGLSWNIESLIAFRVLQGIGGGMLTPVGTAMLFRAFPPSERAAASALLAIPITVAPALGPIVGGYLVEYQDWRWIFFVNIPAGILGLVAATTLLREEKMPNAGRLDIPGFVLAAAGLVSVVYALAEAGRLGFGDPQVLGFGALGLALLALFALVELRTKQPMVDVRLLADPLFRASNVVMLVGFAGQMGTFFVLPLFLQAQKGMTALSAGLVLFPMALGVAVMAQPAAKVYAVVGPRKLMLAGFVGSILVTAWLGFIDYSTPNIWIAVNMFARGAAFGLIMVPLQAATFATIRPEDTGRASSIFNVGRQVAASLGVAVIATALTNRLAFHDAVLGSPLTRGPALTAFHDAFFFAAAVSALGIIAAFLVDDEKAAQAAATEGAFAAEAA